MEFNCLCVYYGVYGGLFHLYSGKSCPGDYEVSEILLEDAYPESTDCSCDGCTSQYPRLIIYDKLLALFGLMRISQLERRLVPGSPTDPFRGIPGHLQRRRRLPDTSLREFVLKDRASTKEYFTIDYGAGLRHAVVFKITKGGNVAYVGFEVDPGVVHNNKNATIVDIRFFCDAVSIPGIERPVVIFHT